MTRSQFTANRFRELFLNGLWIANTNYQELLSNVSLEQATKKIGTLNTIAVLTFHINYYINGILKFFEGGQLEIKDKYSFDLLPLESEKDWEKLRSNLLSNAEKFAQHVEQMSDAQLDAVFVDEKYGTYIRNIEATIEHSYYHLGQISLIKKMVLENFK